MSVSNKILKSAFCLTAALVAANTALAQTAPAAPAAGARQEAATPESTFNRWDKDKNKNLSLDEFKAGWQEVQATNMLRKLHGNFVAMDTNKSGGLEATEFSNLGLVKNTKPAPQFATYDVDKNQKIEFKEYVAMIKAIGQAKR